MRPKRAIFVALSLVLLAASAYADNTFNVSGTLTDGAVLTGTITVDQIGGTVTAFSFTLGAPDSLTTSVLIYGNRGGNFWWIAPGPNPLLVLLLPVSTLVGYNGGPLCSLSAPCSGLTSGLLTAPGQSIQLQRGVVCQLDACPVAAPAITLQPTSQTIASGQMATLSLAASGTAPLSYQWYIGRSGDTANLIMGAMSDNYTTPALISNTRYWVRVSNPYGIADSDTSLITVSFTDDPVTARSSIVRAVHITELRARIDALRGHYLLSPFSYTNPTITAGVSVVQAKDITEMRAALLDVYTMAGMPPPSYSTNPGIGVTVFVADIAEIRAAVIALE